MRGKVLGGHITITQTRGPGQCPPMLNRADQADRRNSNLLVPSRSTVGWYLTIEVSNTWSP